MKGPQSTGPGLQRWLLLGLALICAPGADAQPALTVVGLPGYPGATVTVPVSFRQATNVTAAQFDVAYNPDKVTAGVLVPGTLLSNHLARSREIAPGVRRVLVYSSLNTAVTVTNQATLTSLAFTVPATEYVGSGPITLSKAVLARPDATEVIPVALTSGAIFVRPVNRREDGIVDFFLSSVPGERYLIQATTNLLDWVNISTNVATGSFMQLVDLNAPNYSFRLYRWESLSP